MRGKLSKKIFSESWFICFVSSPKSKDVLTIRHFFMTNVIIIVYRILYALPLLSLSLSLPFSLSLSLSITHAHTHTHTFYCKQTWQLNKTNWKNKKWLPGIVSIKILFISLSICLSQIYLSIQTYMLCHISIHRIMD